MNRIIFILTLTGFLAACGGSGGGGGGPLSNIGPTPDPAAPEETTPPEAQNVVLSYDGATGTVAFFGHAGFNVSNQLSPSENILDCIVTGANAPLFASMGFQLNPYTCNISSTGTEGVLLPTEFSITAVTASGNETAKVTLQSVARTWVAEYFIANSGANWGISTKWKEAGKDFSGPVTWAGTKQISFLAIKGSVLHVLFSDTTHASYTIDSYGNIASANIAQPGSYDIGPASSVQYQVRERVLYQCSANGIQQLVPHATIVNRHIPLANPIIQNSTPLHLEYVSGFLTAYNVDGSVLRYLVDPATGQLIFDSEMPSTSPPPMPSCSAVVI